MSTFRGKLGIGVFGGITVITVGLYLLVAGPWSDEIEKRAEADVRRAVQGVKGIQRLEAYELVALAQQAALDNDFARAMKELGEEARRQAVFDAIAAFDSRLREERRKADFFAVFDRDGRIVARDLNIETMHGEHLRFESVSRALRGQAASDVVTLKNRMMRAGAAPLIVDGQVIGGVIIAYDFTSKEAQEDAGQLGVDVVYFMQGVVRASSFSTAGSAEDSTKLRGIGKALMGKDGVAEHVFGKENAADNDSSLVIGLEGTTYRARAGRLPEAVGVIALGSASLDLAAVKATTKSRHSQVGFVVLADLDARMAPLRCVRYVILAFGIGLLILCFGSMIAVSQHFVSAEDRLELGVSEVISGNFDYTFDTMAEFEGLANALNVMLARLLGRPEPGEDQSDSLRDARVLQIGEIATVGSGDMDRLAAEEAEDYFPRIYREYVEARSTAKLPVAGLDFASFVQKLRANEAMECAKHKCQRIRFVVQLTAGQALLVPVRLA